WVLTFAASDMKRTIGAAPAFLTAVRVFHAFEIGQHIGKSPTLRTHFSPMIKIACMPTHIDHAIDGGGPAQYLAAWCDELPAAKMRLRLGRETPVISFHIHGERQSRGHLDQRANIRATKFHDNNGMFAVFRQAIGHSRTR